MIKKKKHSRRYPSRCALRSDLRVFNTLYLRCLYVVLNNFTVLHKSYLRLIFQQLSASSFNVLLTYTLSYVCATLCLHWCKSIRIINVIQCTYVFLVVLSRRYVLRKYFTSTQSGCAVSTIIKSVRNVPKYGTVPCMMASYANDSNLHSVNVKEAAQQLISRWRWAQVDEEFHSAKEAVSQYFFCSRHH